MDLNEATTQMLALSRSLHAAQDWLRENAADTADKERQYRKGKALAWVTRTDGTAAERQAQVDADTADLRYARDVAEKLERAAVEKVRGVRQEMSMFQTWLAAYRAEAELARFDEGDR